MSDSYYYQLIMISAVKYLIIISCIVLITLVVLYFTSKSISSNNDIQLKKNKKITKLINTGLYSGLKVLVKPKTGTVTCDLSYSNESNSEYTTQCKWVSDSSEQSTNFFANDTIGNYYKLEISSDSDTTLDYYIIKTNYAPSYQTPYNSEIAPLNVAHTRIIEVVPKNSSYVASQKSPIVDFGISNSNNIEFIAHSTENAGNIYLFGSDVNETDKFNLITSQQFVQTQINGFYYIDKVALTNFRYFFIQLGDTTAHGNLYVKLIRRNG